MGRVPRGRPGRDIFLSKERRLLELRVCSWKRPGQTQVMQADRYSGAFPGNTVKPVTVRSFFRGSLFETVFAQFSSIPRSEPPAQRESAQV